MLYYGYFAHVALRFIRFNVPPEQQGEHHVLCINYKGQTDHTSDNA